MELQSKKDIAGKANGCIVANPTLSGVLSESMKDGTQYLQSSMISGALWQHSCEKKNGGSSTTTVSKYYKFSNDLCACVAGSVPYIDQSHLDNYFAAGYT
jgi:hypothetical protein